MRYLPDAGYELSDTRRYTGSSEARINATKDWVPGEKLRTCRGVLATMAEEEENTLRDAHLDFSIMYATRKTPCLFLGPARFMDVSENATHVIYQELINQPMLVAWLRCQYIGK